jgi:hydrogenase nickel incorporation protein HypA/HybF
MHESSLAKQILELSLAEAKRAGGAAVVVVRGRVAESETLSRESLELHFHAHARGTAAAHARLEVELVHVRGRCRACGDTYLPEHHVLLCPRCGSTDGEQLGETGLWIASIDLDDGLGDGSGETR